MSKVIIPTAPNELEEMLNDGKQVMALMKEGQFPDFIKAYADSVQKKDEGIGEQVRIEVQKTMADFLRDTNATTIKRPNLSQEEQSRNSVVRRDGLYNKAATGATLDGKFSDLAEFLVTIAPRNRENPKYADRLTTLRNAYSEGAPADGGFLMPETMRSDIISLALESAIMRPGATVIPMSTAKVVLPAVDVTSHASSVFGGVVAYWTSEAQARTATSAKFKRVALDTSEQSLCAYAEVPNELLNDAPAMTAFLAMAMPEAIIFEEDYKFLMGNGVGEPQGCLKDTGRVSVAIEPGQLADTIVKENIDKMFSRMLPGSLMNAVWIAAIDTFPQLASLAMNVGTGGSPVWLNNGIIDGPPITIYGRPVLFTEKTAPLGDQCDIAFVDRKFYLLGDRQQMTMDASTQYQFAYNKTCYLATERVDGRPWMQSAITPKNGSANTLSAYVVLDERA